MSAALALATQDQLTRAHRRLRSGLPAAARRLKHGWRVRR